MTADTGTALMAHQHDGVEFLTRGQAGLLAFEQGLGKTLVAIEAFRRVRQEGKATRLLVICPNSLKRNWANEIRRFARELDFTIVEGPPQVRRRQFFESKSTVLITSYETARNEVTAILAVLGRQPTAMVLDESHATKNWRSLTSTAARHFAPRSVYRWLLSGTPVTNSPADLFTQIEILVPGERPLGSLESFLEAAELNRSADFAKNTFDRLIMRRTKEQCLDLPEKIFVDIRVELPQWQRRLYDDMRAEMVCAIKEMSGEEYRAFAPTALVKITRLMQLASNPGLLFPDMREVPAKIGELDALLVEMLAEPKRKVIIWSNYVGTIETLLNRFSSYRPVALYGGTPGSERQNIATAFQNDDEVRLLIGNPAAGGAGFTLTAANFAIYETLSWRYDFYAQSQDRNHRIGQSLPVSYIRMIAADTIEEAIINALEKKSALARNLLGDPDSRRSISELTREQMCHLLLQNEIPDA